MSPQRQRPEEESPSFRNLEEDDVEEAQIPDPAASPQQIPAVHSPDDDPATEENEEERKDEFVVGGGDDDDDTNDGDDFSCGEDDDFEFAFVCHDPAITSADEIFSNGQIRPVYPVFGRDVFLFRPVDIAGGRRRGVESGGSGGGGGEEKKEGKVVRMSLRKLMVEEERDQMPSTSSCSSSESDELDGLPADSYCVWTPGSVPPSPDMRRKSKSTGSSSRRWRLRDLVVGRSHSDGKKFVFLTTPQQQQQQTSSPTTSSQSESKEHEDEKKKGKGSGASRPSEMGVVAAHRLFYVKGGEAAASTDQRRSFLPYRKDLVGIFTSVNGTSRGFHPF